MPPPKPRPVRIAVSGTRCKDVTPEGAAQYWASQIAIAGRQSVDLIVLPEYSAGSAYDDPKALLKCSTPVPGPATAIVAEAAKQAKSVVVYNLIENDRDVLYNTSVLFDRDGKIIGRYRKVHLAIYETWAGITPNEPLPIAANRAGRGRGQHQASRRTQILTFVSRSARQVGAECLRMPFLRPPTRPECEGIPVRTPRFEAELR